MPTLIISLAILVLLLVLLRERDSQRLERLRADHTAQIEAIRIDTAAQLAIIVEQAANERRSLLDRIQHPRVLQHSQIYEPKGSDIADLNALEPFESSRDEIELAYVGTEVPPGVSVGILGAEDRDASVV